MQPSQIKLSLDAFIDGEDRVMVIRGAWGVGKTHYWSNYVSDRMKDKSLNQIAYSYLSLFGKSSLPEIRASIFQAGKPIANDDEIKKQFDKEYQNSTGLLRNAPWLNETKGKLTKLARFSGWLTNLMRSTPFTDKYSRLVASLEYKLVSNYLICIDDLERKGSSLSIREIMGLIDELANQKKCKIVLIFNDRSLKDKQDKQEFDEYREKVVDAEIEYEPTHAQAFACAFRPEDPSSEDVLKITKILDIKNIRVLRKLKRIIQAFSQPLKDVDPLISSEFLNHAAVQIWSRYMQADALPYDFILYRIQESPWAGYFRNNDEISDNEKRYRSLAQQTNLSPSIYSDFITDYIVKGYVDLASVSHETQLLSITVSQKRTHAELNSIWRMYTDSLEDNLAEIKARFLEILESQADKISLNEYSAVLEMLSELDVDVKYLVENYVSLHQAKLAAIDPEDFTIQRHVSFEPLRTRVKELNTNQRNLSIDEVTERVLNRSWKKGDIEYLASLSSKELSEWMQSSPGNPHLKIRGGLLFFGDLGGASDEDNIRYRKIFDTTVEALQLIASTNEINKRRIASFYKITKDS